MDKAAVTIFRAFVREVLRNEPRDFSNKKKVIQSSVGMVFRLQSKTLLSSPQQMASCVDYQGIELLFTQRAGYEKDRNACTLSPSQTTSYSQEDNATGQKLTCRPVSGSSRRKSVCKYS